MTVYWVDPYLESSGGGIHGTSGNGSGTYASPWKLSHLLSNNTATKLGTLASGDEVRFKGLPFDDFFGTQQAWSSTPNNPSSYSHATFNRRFMYALRKDTGEKYYKAQYSSNNNFRFPPGSSTWNEHFPLLDTGGIYVMDADKSISQSTIYTENQNNTNMYFLKPSSMSGGTSGIGRHGITVTAGWVSETSQTGGMTIIHSNANRSDSADTWRWGGSSTNEMGCVNWDCRNTLIIAVSQYQNPYIYGGDVKLEAFKGSSYMPGYGVYIYSNGDIDIGHVGTGGYSYLYHYMQDTGENDENKHTYNFELDRWTMGYSSQNHYSYWPSQSQTDNYSNTTTRTLNAYIKLTDGQYGWRFQDNNSGSSYPGTFNLTFRDGYHHSKYETGHSVQGYNTNYKTVNVTQGTVSTHAPYFSYNNNIEENAGYGGLGQNPNNNYNFGSLNNNTRRLVSDASNIFSAASTDTVYRAFNTSLDLADSSLELAQGNPLNFNQDPGDRLPWKVTVLRNDKDRRPLTLVSPESAGGPSYAQFNSPSNSNKLVWHFFNNNAGLTYSDNYALQIPDYSSNDLRLNWDVSHTSGLGVTFRITLYYIHDKALGATGNDYAFSSNYKFGPYTSPTTTSTTAVFAQTISSSTLTDVSPKYIWAFCEVIKASGNNTVGNVIFNQLDLTQIT